MEGLKMISIVTPDTILLDLVERCEGASDIFNRYNALAGECILCYNLFEPLKKVVEKYKLNGVEIMSELKALEKAEQ